MCACTCVRVGVGACMHVLKELRVHTCARVDGSARAHVIGVCPFSLSQQEAAVCAIRLLLLLLFSPPLSSPRGAHGMPEGSPRCTMGEPRCPRGPTGRTREPTKEAQGVHRETSEGAQKALRLGQKRGGTLPCLLGVKTYAEVDFFNHGS